MSIKPYNNLTVRDLTNNVQQPYVNSCAEFGYFGSRGSVLNCNSMPTILFTNNGVALVDDVSGGLFIPKAGIYTLNISIDCSGSTMNATDNGIIYFNLGTQKLTNTTFANINTGFGSSQTDGIGMFTSSSTASTYPGIISWLVNSYTSDSNTTKSNFLVTTTNKYLVWGYQCGNLTTNGPISSGICTTEITFVLDTPTTIYFNIGCVQQNLTTNLSLTMGTSYFTLELISTFLLTWTWTQPTGLVNSINRFWYSIASSSDGVKLAALVWGGQIWTSTNSGQTWGGPYATAQAWRSIASSSDGTKLAAVAQDGQIWMSTDSGLNWGARATPQYWRSIASSSDGTKLAAVVNGINASGGQIYTSTDSGLTWGGPYATVQNWISIASSSDGSKLAAVVEGGYIYTSTDYGLNWSTARATSQYWQSIASSSDGTKLAAVVSGGQIYTSTDSGQTWSAPITPVNNNNVNRDWRSIASSSDGVKLAAGVFNQQIWTSTDSGQTWTGPYATAQSWISIASSSDGTKLAAGVYNGKIYTGVATY